jgi:hypothetical protein
MRTARWCPFPPTAPERERPCSGPGGTVRSRDGRGWSDGGGGLFGEVLDAGKVVLVDAHDAERVQPPDPDRFDAGRPGELGVWQLAAGVGGGAVGELLELGDGEPSGVAGLPLGGAELAGDGGPVQGPVMSGGLAGGPCGRNGWAAIRQ